MNEYVHTRGRYSANGHRIILNMQRRPVYVLSMVRNTTNITNYGSWSRDFGGSIPNFYTGCLKLWHYGQSRGKQKTKKKLAKKTKAKDRKKIITLLKYGQGMVSLALGDGCPYKYVCPKILCPEARLQISLRGNSREPHLPNFSTRCLRLWWC